MEEIFMRKFLCIFISFVFFFSCSTDTTNPNTNDTKTNATSEEKNTNNNETSNNKTDNNKINTKNTSQDDTVRVYLKAGPWNVTYSIIDNEGNTYKAGNLLNSEIITINHFKKGQYNIHFKVGSYVATYDVININKNCSIDFINYNSVTVTEDNTNNNTDITNNSNATYKVLLKAPNGRVVYSIINNEGDAYKEGTLLVGETLTINNFITGEYHIQFKLGGYVPALSIITITRNCTILFDNPTSITVQ